MLRQMQPGPQRILHHRQYREAEGKVLPPTDQLFVYGKAHLAHVSAVTFARRAYSFTLGWHVGSWYPSLSLAKLAVRESVLQATLHMVQHGTTLLMLHVTEMSRPACVRRASPMQPEALVLQHLAHASAVTVAQ